MVEPSFVESAEYRKEFNFFLKSAASSLKKIRPFKLIQEMRLKNFGGVHSAFFGVLIIRAKCVGSNLQFSFRAAMLAFIDSAN